MAGILKREAGRHSGRPKTAPAVISPSPNKSMGRTRPESLPSQRVVVVSKRWGHHTASGGFDRLADFLQCTVVHRQSLSWYDRLMRKTIHRWWKPNYPLLDYKFADLVTEKKALAKARTQSARVVHVLYGDEQLDFLLYSRRRLPTKLVATFHLPWFRSESRFKEQRKLLGEAIDHFVTVSSDLAAELANLFGPHRVSFIPHGIDTTVFCASSVQQKTGKIQLLTVGCHMRDLELVRRLADYAKFAGLPISFSYVGPHDAGRLFSKCENMLAASGIDENRLVEMYQSADALLLPVTAATANNSLLEAISCGTPVISTDLPGIRDYLDETSGWLLPRGDLQAAKNLVSELARSPVLCHAKRHGARAMAERFAWPRVAECYQGLYAKLVGLERSET